MEKRVSHRLLDQSQASAPLGNLQPQAFTRSPFSYAESEGSHPEFEINPYGSTDEPRTVDCRPSHIFTMVGLLEGQRKADRAVQELVFLKFLLQLCAALKPSCRPEESEGFVQSLWQLPATCGRITQGDMPNCKNCARQSNAVRLLVSDSGCVCATGMESNFAGQRQEFSRWG